MGKPRDAIKDYDKALAVNPKDAATFIRKGYANIDLKAYDAAVVDFTAAIDLKTPFSSYAYNNRGNAKRLLKDYEGALKDVNQSLQMDSLNAFGYSNRGLIRMDKDEQEAALKDLDRAIELNNQVAEFYYNRGNYYLNLKKYDKATADYSKSMDLSPEYKQKEIPKLLKVAKKGFLSEN
jgi:tetratricopeptide (TPR) repeat protein